MKITAFKMETFCNICLHSQFKIYHLQIHLTSKIKENKEVALAQHTLHTWASHIPTSPATHVCDYMGYVRHVRHAARAVKIIMIPWATICQVYTPREVE